MNVSNTGVPSLPLPEEPGVGKAPEQKTTAATGETLAKINDDISTSVERNEAAFTKAYNSVTPDEPFVPVPFAGSSQGYSKGDPHDSGGRGNPWLVPNPVVYIQIQMLALYESMRQSNLVMAEYEITTMELNSAYAETAASLIIQAGEAEAKMAMLEGIAAGVAAGASMLALGVSGGSFGHSMTAGRDSVAAAKTKMQESQEELGNSNSTTPTSELDANTKSGQFEIAQRDHASKQKTLDGLKDQRAALENPSAGTSKPNAAQKAQQHKEIEALDKKIDAQKTEVSSAERVKDQKHEEFMNAQKAHANNHSEYVNKQQAQFTSFNNWTQMAGMANTFFSQFAAAGTKFASMEEITNKALAQATQQIVDALRENIKQSGQAASQTQQQTKEAMSSIIQNMDKMVDETTRAMTMGRGG